MTVKYHGDSGDLVKRARSMTYGGMHAELIDRIEALESAVEAARKLEHEINQTYDVDDGQPNYPFGKELEDLQRALCTHDGDREAKP